MRCQNPNMHSCPVFESAELMDVRIHHVVRTDLLAYLEWALATRTPSFVNGINAHAFNLAWDDADFRMILNRSDLVFVDGYGVLLGARLAGMQFSERLTFADWMDAFFERCIPGGWSVFWLGDTDEVGAAFEHHLAQCHPGLRFAGRHHGFFDREGAENDEVIAKINASGADVLLVGMSMPIQEKWLWRNRDKLQAIVRISSGGYARVATGIIPRGPRWMTDHGLEWLYRFLQQPGYTWRRYLLGNPLFILRLLRWRYWGVSPSDS